MATKILPVWCPVKVKLDDGREVACFRRGLKSHGGLCVFHRRERAEREAAERDQRRAARS